MMGGAATTALNAPANQYNGRLSPGCHGDALVSAMASSINDGH